MKKLFFALFILSFYSTFAQSLPGDVNPNFQPVLDEEKETQGYVGVNLRLGQILDKNAYELGFKVALKISNYVYLGIHYNYLYNNSIFIPDKKVINGVLTDNSGALMMQYGGLNVGLPIELIKNIYVEPEISLGILYINKSVNLSIPLSEHPNGSWCYYISPSINFNYKINNKFFVGIGTSFYQALGINFINLNNNSLSGIRFQLGFSLLL
jgi:hypothetical protein